MLTVVLASSVVVRVDLRYKLYVNETDRGIFFQKIHDQQNTESSHAVPRLEAWKKECLEWLECDKTSTV